MSEEQNEMFEGSVNDLLAQHKLGRRRQGVSRGLPRLC